MNRLKELRQEKKLSQKELAEKLSFPLRTYQRLENGESQIKPDKAQLLADFFGVSVGYLLGYATVDDVMALTIKVMTNQIRLEEISDKKTRKAVSNYIDLNKGSEPNHPFTADYSLNAIEKINDIKLVDEMLTDAMLANRLLDRLRHYMMESGIIKPGSYHWEIEGVMTWLMDFNDELFKRKVSLSGGKMSFSSRQHYQHDDLYKPGNDR
ncbi:UNVERIFIED_CONTAM: helix-turn-helix transcriptional regulator [Streptococcus canis]|uniref:helix-turn-helix domain-containing protein n=1 Tax=Streptococcus canis TaxID=1329 RepID=UPI0024DE29BC|nr:helix-turn-helix transcriptional regulator [Streptococcus canis]